MKWYLDFGHGGKDSGAVSANKTKESDTVLKIGKLIKANLEKAGEKVITTRDTDLYFSLDYRSNKANKQNCDYFVSLHMNASTNKDAKGVEVWVYDEKSKVYNLAKNICSNLSRDINTPNRGVKISKSFSVLRKTKMPSLLIEIDFISNLCVENALKDETYIKNISQSISNSLLSFVNKPIIDDNFSYCICTGKFKDKDIDLY